MKKEKKILFIIIIIIVLSISIPITKAVFKSGSNADDSLSVAGWSVSLNQTGINNNLNLVPGENTATYRVRVNCNAEVDAKYSIVLGNVPTGVEVSLDSGPYRTPTNNTITFNNAGTILYSSNIKENEHIMEFRAVSGTANVYNQTLTVDVIIEQEL